jgi:hypothetical protein
MISVAIFVAHIYFMVLRDAMLVAVVSHGPLSAQALAFRR